MYINFNIEDKDIIRRLIDIATSNIICVIALTLGDQFDTSDNTVFFG